MIRYIVKIIYRKVKMSSNLKQMEISVYNVLPNKPKIIHQPSSERYII